MEVRMALVARMLPTREPLGWACVCRTIRLLFASPISRGQLAVYARKLFQSLIEEGYLWDERTK